MSIASARRQRAAVQQAVTRLVGVAAFWRNDHEGGLSVYLGFSSGASEPFVGAVQRAMTVYDASPNREPYLAWLAEVAPRKERLSKPEIFRAIASISWLEQRGHLVPDEFNGVIWLGRRDGELVSLSCEELFPSTGQQPS
jgi:hypothetical protein